jgi:sarcosine oxidase subunit alpha
VKRQPNRLPADARHGLGGAEIDRGRPLAFRLNGRSYEAFAGDTVLSALLAAGVDGAGFYGAEAIALDERFAPPVAPARAASDPVQAMPMDRTPVVAGLDLRTLGPLQGRLPLSGIAARVAGLVAPRSTTLGHRFDEPRALLGPWLELPAATTLDADTIVVGAGLAGMSAALAAADAGGRVILVERRLMTGGDARFFGTVGDEDSPETLVTRLSEKIARTPSITLLTGTDATSLAGARLMVHQVRVNDGALQSRNLALRAPRIVLATGTGERLPVFPGNRLPAVAGAVAAFHRADRYGVWAGSSALFAMPHSFGYRLALLAADAGITVQRAADSRINPQSRFVDFCKASGITLASGQIVRIAEAAGKGSRRLSVGFANNVGEDGRDTASIETDLLVAAGGWQPRLALWLMAGGASAWDGRRHWLGPQGSLEAVALAGSAAGYRSSTACIASGAQAVATLLGREPAPVEDIEVDAIYESRDDTTSIAPWRAGRIAWLDRGMSFTARPPRRDDPTVPASLQHLSLGDVAASVELKTIPPADAGAIAEERCVGGGDIADSGWRVPAAAAPPSLSPPYLHGRFGPRPQLAVVAATDGRFFEAGCLLYPSSTSADPAAAIGAIVGPAPDGRPGGLAAANRAALAAAASLFVRDTSGAVAVSVVDKEKKKPAKPA